MFKMIQLCFSTVKSSISILIGVVQLSLSFITAPIFVAISLILIRFWFVMINHFPDGTSKNFEGL